jgi:hypothetical protein
MVRTVVESIHDFYSPRNIYIIIPKCYYEEIIVNIKSWSYKNIFIIEEETFFVKNYNMYYNDIYNHFSKNIDERSRNFGWWYQQLIKLGAFIQINGLSDPYIVWDSDLIPLIKWDIYPTYENPHYKFAILQEKSRNNWLTEQYRDSLYFLTQLPICDPNVGTFVPHHFVMYHNVLKNLIKHIEKISQTNWILSIIKLSHNYFRFSEYRTISSFMKLYYPQLLHYNDFDNFGKFGIRIREPCNFLLDMEKFLYDKNIDISSGISYIDFIEFSKSKYNNLPSYLQIEHI